MNWNIKMWLCRHTWDITSIDSPLRDMELRWCKKCGKKQGRYNSLCHGWSSWMRLKGLE